MVIEEGEEMNLLVVVGFSKEAAWRSYGGWKLVVKKEEEEEGRKKKIKMMKK